MNVGQWIPVLVHSVYVPLMLWNFAFLIKPFNALLIYEYMYMYIV